VAASPTGVGAALRPQSLFTSRLRDGSIPAGAAGLERPARGGRLSPLGHLVDGFLNGSLGVRLGIVTIPSRYRTLLKSP